MENERVKIANINNLRAFRSSSKAVRKHAGDDLDHIWTQVMDHLEKQLSKPSFETWIKNTALVGLDHFKKEAIIAAPNEFARDWLETRYTKLVKEGLYYLTNHFYRITFIRKTESESLPKDELKLFDFLDTLTLPINSNNTFESFATNPNNCFAKIAAKTFADTFDKDMNPLLIWGPPNSGKTHLLQAIGNEVLKKNGDAEIIYITTEHFKNVFHLAGYFSQIILFKNSFQKANIVLIDDLDFIETDEQAQFELFNIFNDLFSLDIQIIFASRKAPKELQFFDKLKERLTWGLVTEIELGENSEVASRNNGKKEVNHVFQIINQNSGNEENNHVLPNSIQTSEQEKFYDAAIKEETNKFALESKIDQLIQEQKRTNEWLEKIFDKL